MRYLSLAEALVIAEAATGIDARTLSRASRIDLLDSALHAPQAGFGDEDFYPSIVEKAAVLVVRIARNHPLPDGNKRLAWQTLTIFLALNGHRLEIPADEAVNEGRCGVATGSPRHPSWRWLRDSGEDRIPTTFASFAAWWVRASVTTSSADRSAVPLRTNRSVIG